jgi:hypothetical protein
MSKGQNLSFTELEPTFIVRFILKIRNDHGFSVLLNSSSYYIHYIPISEFLKPTVKANRPEPTTRETNSFAKKNNLQQHELHKMCFFFIEFIKNLPIFFFCRLQQLRVGAIYCDIKMKNLLQSCMT